MSSSIEINWEKFGRGEGTYVKVDGKEVARVTSVKVDMGVEDAPRVVIECIAANGYLKIDEGDVTIKPTIATMDRKERPRPEPDLPDPLKEAS